jgi:hypothetical protein
MAKEEIEMWFDDLDRSPAEETVEFSLDNRRYKIDLSAVNADAFRQAMSPYVAKATKIKGGRKPLRPQPSVPDKTVVELHPGVTRGDFNRAVRAWAAKNKIPVASRGRIEKSVIARYEADQAKQAAPPATPKRGRGKSNKA